jgi:hypothetical protein
MMLSEVHEGNLVPEAGNRLLGWTGLHIETQDQILKPENSSLNPEF